jgi:hypothetical protein
MFVGEGGGVIWNLQKLHSRYPGAPQGGPGSFWVHVFYSSIQLEGASNSSHSWCTNKIKYNQMESNRRLNQRNSSKKSRNASKHVKTCSQNISKRQRSRSWSWMKLANLGVLPPPSMTCGNNSARTKLEDDRMVCQATPPSPWTESVEDVNF